METPKKSKKPIYKRIWFWIVVALALFFLIPFGIGIGIGIMRIASGEHASPTPKSTEAQLPEATPAPVVQHASPTPAVPSESLSMPTVAPTAAPAPTNTPTPTQRPTASPAAPTPTVAPPVSEAVKAIYTDVMWAIMHGELDREEAAIMEDYAAKYAMSVDALNALIRRVGAEAYSRERDPIAEHKCGMFGDVESIVDYWDGMCVVSVLIEPSYNDKATVNQNFHNVESLILDGGGDRFREIQYYAFVTDASGDRVKAVSFSLDSDLIQRIKNREVFAIDMGNYVDDLWEHGQLR